MANDANLETLAINTIRTLAMDAVQQANSVIPAGRWAWPRLRLHCFRNSFVMIPPIRRGTIA